MNDPDETAQDWDAHDWDSRDILALLSVEPDGDDRFVTRVNQLNSNQTLFGGQLLGQALLAASATVAGHVLHSMHAYFLYAGTNLLPVRYTVERVRDGRSFTVRRVEARQAHNTLFHLECSFHATEHGWSHQTPMPEVPPPEGLLDLHTIAASLEPALAARLGGRILSALEVRPIDPMRMLQRQEQSRRQLWFRTPGVLGHPDPAMHRATMAWMTDYWINGAGIVQHATPLPGSGLQLASLDHAMWFHREADAGDWLLLDFDSPSASGATGLARALIYDRAGRLVATAMQESLQRPAG